MDLTNPPDEVQVILEEIYKFYPDNEEHFTLYDYYEMGYSDLEKEYDLDEEYESKWCIAYRWDNALWEDFFSDSPEDDKRAMGPRFGKLFIKLEDGERKAENHTFAYIKYGVDLMDDYRQYTMFYGFGSYEWAREYEKGVGIAEIEGIDINGQGLPVENDALLEDRYREFPEDQELFTLYDYFEMPFSDLDKEYDLDEDYESKWCVSFRWDDRLYEEKYADSPISINGMIGPKTVYLCIFHENGEMEAEGYGRAQYNHGVDFWEDFQQSIMFYESGSCDWAREYETDLAEGKFK